MIKHPTLFITHRGHWHQQNVLYAAPPELEITMCRDAGQEDLLNLLPGKEFLITEREDIIDTDAIAAGKDLRLIQRLGSQTYDIDLQAAQKAGIPVCYWPDQTTINVAEHCVMQTLALMKRLRDSQATMNFAQWDRAPRRSDEDTFAYNWSARRGITTLQGATVGILGFGEIGRDLAVRLKGFGARVLYHKRRRMSLSAEEHLNIAYAEPDPLVEQSDVVCCLLPYAPESDQSLNEAFFNRMKHGSYFVFCGGSGIVDETALINALYSGHIFGAALDTYTWEPLPTNSPLLDLHRDLSVNLILTPHVAAGTGNGGRESHYSNLLRVIAGEPLLYRVV